jgi:peptide chain release factor subunit 1
MHYTLKKQILTTLDTAYIGEQGVKEIVDRSSETIRRVRYIEEKELVQSFLYELGHDTGMSVYGYDEVLISLNQGVVKTLLLSEGLDAKGVDLSCSVCGKPSTRTLFGPDSLKFEENLNKEICPECGSTSLSLIQEKDLLDILADLAEERGIDVEVISTETEEGSMLLRSFGGIAAVLHFAHR